MTTYTVTPEQREKIERAIALAEGPGESSYRAGCVIAQLANLEGVSIRRVLNWDRRDEYGIVVLRRDGLVRELAPYPTALLKALQEEWDGYGYASALPNARARLLAAFHRLIGATTDA